MNGELSIDVIAGDGGFTSLKDPHNVYVLKLSKFPTL